MMKFCLCAVHPFSIHRSLQKNNTPAAIGKIDFLAMKNIKNHVFLRSCAAWAVRGSRYRLQFRFLANELFAAKKITRFRIPPQVA